MQFSSKYHEEQFPERYARKHAASLSRRINDGLEKRLLRNALALAGQPASIMDVGCGPGRFWSVLAENAAPDLFALDISEAMVRFAQQDNEPAVADRFRVTTGSVLALPVCDKAIDCVVSMRLLHHFGDDSTRQTALSELARISRQTVIVSLWVDGNYKSWRRGRLESRRGAREYSNRHIVTREQLARDIDGVGLNLLNYYDLVPGYSQWRYYVLAHRNRHGAL